MGDCINEITEIPTTDDHHSSFTLALRHHNAPCQFQVIKFEGCYHGHADGFLVQAGSGVATLGLPDSPGVPAGSTAGTLVAQYNDLDSVEQLLKNKDVAAVILEPVVGNSGFIPPTKEFLEGLRELTTKYEALLVFDEVCDPVEGNVVEANKMFLARQIVSLLRVKVKGEALVRRARDRHVF